MRRQNITVLTTTLFITFVFSCLSHADGQENDQKIKSNNETRFISNVRQLTFEGRRAGEGYYSADGTKMVFQSERRGDNPFFQIYLLDFEFGEVEPISPGHGKTTCAWVHPSGNKVLYSSTQGDPQARAKQLEEIEIRESGKARRYSWDYDQTYEIYSYDTQNKKYDRLTNAVGYDAEGSYSPDGKLIAFASNRNAYSSELNERDQAAFDQDPATMMEIFIMNADGTNIRQLTDVPGYDGGPFFSPDGKRICWRRFALNGATAEIMTMNIDGSDQRQLTQMRAMSWAPFYHPSGKYLIYTTNKHGFGNFELYLVDVEGKSQPVRVTTTEGFDGLASFSPDGKKLTWTTARNEKKSSQIFLADWNHEFALESLAVTHSADDEAAKLGTESAASTSASFDPRDVMRHVDYLCRKELGGRMTGSDGEKQATRYVAAYLDSLGVKPAGDNGSWFQKFKFPAGSQLGPNNRLDFEIPNGSGSSQIDQDWRPLAFSNTGDIEPSDVVFAGYGIVAPAGDGQEEYDSYVHLDVKDKWAVVFRYMPEGITPERRQHLQYHSSLRKKAMDARDKGARGIIVVSGPNSKVRNQLVTLENDFARAGSSVGAISITDKLATSWFDSAGKDLQALQNRLDSGDPMMGFPLKGVSVSVSVDVKQLTGQGRNVVGRMQMGDEPHEQAILVGAHIDHLGRGTGGSLAKNDEKNAIHFGADDNASGVAAMLEVAEYLSDLRRKGKLNMQRDVIFAAWSGEELGLHGSQHFVTQIQQAQTAKKLAASKTPVKPPADGSNPHDITVEQIAEMVEKFQAEQGGLEVSDLKSAIVELSLLSKFMEQGIVQLTSALTLDPKNAELKNSHSQLVQTLKRTKEVLVELESTKTKTAASTVENSIYPYIAACLNMDMVGRFEKQLVLQGISSSDYWTKEIEKRNAVVGLPVKLNDDTQLPTDASSFYRAGVPILAAFTGSHTDYHTPRDTPEKLNYPAAARIANLMGLMTRGLVISKELPKYLKQSAAPKQQSRGVMRAYLGTVPDYAGDVIGVLLSDATEGAPAHKAGIRSGDIIVELAGRKIENIYDFTYAIEALKVGQETAIVVKRDGKRLELKVTPGSRD